jgi:hypothetical protein
VKTFIEIIRDVYARERRCPGLRSGWYLQGNREMWYGLIECGKPARFFRWLFNYSYCTRCSRVAYRRGFRLNCDTAP